MNIYKRKGNIFLTYDTERNVQGGIKRRKKSKFISYLKIITSILDVCGEENKFYFYYILYCKKGTYVVNIHTYIHTHTHTHIYDTGIYTHTGKDAYIKNYLMYS